jgi:uncharacterized protein
VINKVCHFEIGCRDSAQAKDFYSQVFNWRFEKNPRGEEMIRTGDDVSGHFAAPRDGQRSYVVFYVMVDSVDSAMKKAESLGGKTVLGPVKEQHGTYAWIADPDGNVVGVYSESGQ